VKVINKIEIDPPIEGQYFRVIIDKAHKTGPNIQGRFDLWTAPIRAEKEKLY